MYNKKLLPGIYLQRMAEGLGGPDRLWRCAWNHAWVVVHDVHSYHTSVAQGEAVVWECSTTDALHCMKHRYVFRGFQ